jgi:hypothetical protein
MTEATRLVRDDAYEEMGSAYQCLLVAILGRFPISNAIDGRVFLEENFSGSAKAEACAGTTVE